MASVISRMPPAPAEAKSDRPGGQAVVLGQLYALVLSWRTGESPELKNEPNRGGTLAWDRLTSKRSGCAWPAPQVWWPTPSGARFSFHRPCVGGAPLRAVYRLPIPASIVDDSHLFLRWLRERQREDRHEDVQAGTAHNWRRDADGSQWLLSTPARYRPDGAVWHMSLEHRR